MANGKQTTARRREVRRNVPKPRLGFMQQLYRKEVIWALLFAVAFSSIAAFFATQAKERPAYQVGQLISRPIVASVPFTAIDADQTKQRQEAARRYQPAVYVHNESYFEDLERNFDHIIALADKSQKIDEVPEPFRKQVKLTQTGLTRLHRFARDETQLQRWRGYRRDFLRAMFDQAILTPKSIDDEKNPLGAFRIIIVHPDPLPQMGAEEIRDPGALISVEDKPLIEKQVQYLASKGFPKELQETIAALVMDELQPTYLLDPEQTRRLRDLAYESEPPVEAHYDAQQLVIPAGTNLTPSQITTLGQMHHTVLQEAGLVQCWISRGGIFGIMLLIIGAMWLHVFAYSDRISRNPMRGLAITVLLLLCQIMAVTATRVWPDQLMLTVSLPTLLAAMVLAIAYNQRFALAIGVVLSIIVVVSVYQPIGVGLVLLSGVATAIAQLREVRSRSKLVWVGFWSGLAMGLTSLIVNEGMRPLYLTTHWQLALIHTLQALGSGLLAGLLAQGILPIIEKMFKVTTAMTLKDLNDASHPLLQRLAQESTGTYQHSLRIADMAEAAAEAIGADTLACRVGAMYHDIGKINKPLYFIENQGGGPNKHNKLSPAMSLLIIVGHVKDGVEMAREYGLPSVIRHMIESHHGTTLVEYFYHAARRQTEAEDKPGPSEFEFRYPGPKPKTREAAIMLLADGIEAAARALPDPTPIRLEQLVDNIASKRLMDGQFADSNLTLRELKKIQQAITKTICAIYHARIKYPSENNTKPADHVNSISA